VDDLVIGTVIDKLGESYKVDLGGAAPAVLSALAFEGATRKNRPLLTVGSVVYARVAVANKDMETELVCTAKQGASSVDGLGELTGGYVFKCGSMALSRSYARRPA
jgi:exosome complex component RRP40